MFEFFLRSTLFCFSFEYCWLSCLGIHFDCALSVKVLPNLSSFDQSTVSSSLRKFVKPKKSEKHSQSSVSKIISKPGCGLVVIICANKNKQYIYTNKDVIIYPGKGLHLRVFRNWLNEFFCKTLVKQLFSMN